MKLRQINNSGFTLIEILVALSILSIVIVPVVGVFTSTAQSNYKSNQSMVALTVATDIMDKLKSGAVPEIYPDITTDIDVSETNGLKKITVTVTPSGGNPVVLSSYTNNSYIPEIEETVPQEILDDYGSGDDDTGDTGDGGEIPEPPESGGEDDYDTWYRLTLETIGVAIVGILIFPIYLSMETDLNLIEAIIASYEIIVDLYNEQGEVTWDNFKSEATQRHGITFGGAWKLFDMLFG